MAEQPDDFWTFTPPASNTPAAGPPITTPAEHAAPAHAPPDAAPMAAPPAEVAAAPPVDTANAPPAPDYSPTGASGGQQGSFDFFSRTMGEYSSGPVDPSTLPSNKMGMPEADSVYRSSATGGIASFKLRWWAYATDTALLYLPLALLFLTTSLIFEPVKGTCQLPNGTRTVCEMLTSRDQAILLGCYAAIFAIFGIFNRVIAVAIWGGSMGKMLVGIRIVSYSGKKIGFFRALWRFLFAETISRVFFSLGYWWAFFSENSRTWHDYAAGTVVVEL